MKCTLDQMSVKIKVNQENNSEFIHLDLFILLEQELDSLIERLKSST